VSNAASDDAAPRPDTRGPGADAADATVADATANEAIADPVEKIGDLAAEAGIRRIHVLAWRDLDDDEAGGSEVHIHEIARRWAAAGLEVTQRTSHAEGQPVEATRDGYRVIRRAGRHMVFPRAAAAEVLRRTGPRDVLVEIWNGMPFLSPVWCRGPRVVFLHHIHAEMWKMVLPGGVARLGNLLEERIAPPLYRSSPIITLSDSSKREMVEDVGFRDEQVTVVPPGIDPRFSPGGERSATPLAVAVGRLAPVKRYDVLVRAAAVAREQVPDLQLHIVGEGYERPTIEAAIDAVGGADWITLRGHVSDAELIELYRQAWVVTSASAREGWGMTLTEAAACGTPAVATRIAGHEDAVTDQVSGVLTGSTADDLGATLGKVLADRHHLDQLRAGALARAASLTWDNTAIAVTRVLADTVAGRQSRR
jgi:glycosyltransferase involved in cell wall biosynthesis